MGEGEARIPSVAGVKIDIYAPREGYPTTHPNIWALPKVGGILTEVNLVVFLLLPMIIAIVIANRHIIVTKF